MTTTLDHPTSTTAPAIAPTTTDTPQAQPQPVRLSGDVAFLATPVLGVCCALATREFGDFPGGAAALAVWLLILALTFGPRELS